MEKNFTSINKLRQRFVKDYNLPINVFREDLWNHYMALYDFFPHYRWDSLVVKVYEEFGGNVEKWLDYCAKVRDAAILGTMETDAYKKFNSLDLKDFDIKVPAPTSNCYTESTNGKRFISIDLVKANFQVMKFTGVLEDNTYADFIRRCDGDEYIINSKYLRQVIFGKMNPSRQIKIERWIMSQIAFIATNILKDRNFELFSFNNDELIYEDKSSTPEDSNDMRDVFNEISSLVLFDVNMEYIEVERLPIVSPTGNAIDAYVRRNLITGEEKLKKASTTFFPQIYKLWKGLTIEDKDLYFFAENQLARFCEPLRLDC